MKPKHSVEDDVIQDSLFDDSEVKVPETADQKAGREAKAIFDEWYEMWYKGRYTQSPGQIMKVLKKIILKGDVDPYYLKWAMNILGEQSQVVTENSLQFAFSRIMKHLESKGMSMNTEKPKREYVESI